MKKVDYHKDIFVIEDFLSAEECLQLINKSEETGYEEAKVQVGNGQQSMIKAVRNNERIMFADEELANTLWEKAQPFVASNMGNYEAIGLNEMWRFYKYSPGQRFKMHRDGSFERNDTELSFYTFMIYLNDDFEGGETAFESICSVSPKTGSLLIFYHPLRHEGKKLESGVKYVLRTDIMYRLM
jgi:prolyl 4-hydroxylase